MHRKGGVHDMAFTNGMGPRMHHVAFWVPTPLNIIDLLDGMGFLMRSSYIYWTQTVIELKFIVLIIKLLILI